MPVDADDASFDAPLFFSARDGLVILAAACRSTLPWLVVAKLRKEEVSLGTTPNNPSEGCVLPSAGAEAADLPRLLLKKRPSLLALAVWMKGCVRELPITRLDAKRVGVAWIIGTPAAPRPRALRAPGAAKDKRAVAISMFECFG